jgi:hypothetical protein
MPRIMPFRFPSLVPTALAGTAVGLRLVLTAWMAAAAGGLAEATCHFDCGWYERLALAGYGADTEWADLGSLPHWAFFPLYPLLLRAGIALTHLPPRLCGVLLSAVLLAGLVMVGGAYLRRTRPAMSVLTWTLVAVLFPSGVFFTAVYSEALFALLAAATFLSLRSGRPLLAACWAALASATRPTGVLLLPIIAADRLAAVRSGWREGARTRLLADALLPVAVAPLGLAIFMLAQYVQVGDGLAFSHVQTNWGRIWEGPAAVLWQALSALDLSVFAPLAEPSRTLEALWALLGLSASLWLAARNRFGEAWFLAGCVLLPLASAPDSMGRYVGCNPVFLFAVYDFVTALRGRAALAAAYGGLAVLHVAFMAAWLSGAKGLY